MSNPSTPLKSPAAGAKSPISGPQLADDVGGETQEEGVKQEASTPNLEDAPKNGGVAPMTSTPKPPNTSADAGMPKKKEKLLNVKIPTKKAQKRKHIRTSFDDDGLEQSALDAQRKEKQRLERLEKTRQSNPENHITQMEALLQQTAVLPQLSLDTSDFDEILSGATTFTPFGGPIAKTEARDDDLDVVEVKPGNLGRSSCPSTSKDEPEVILLSSDDENDFATPATTTFDNRRGRHYRHSHAPLLSTTPSLSWSFSGPGLSQSPQVQQQQGPVAGRRNRWLTSEKDRADFVQMEEQQKREKERLRRVRQADLEKMDINGGRLIVNSGHPTEDPDVFVSPHLTYILQPHQLGGVRFMYDNVIESMDAYKTTAGFGCILAHSMGLGKTIQVITFSEIFLRVTDAKKVLIIVPINTIQNWLAEYEKWLPRNSNDGDKVRSFDVRILGDTMKTFDQRVNLIEEWNERGGVLLIGYDMFRLLIRSTQPKRKEPRPKLHVNGNNCHSSHEKKQEPDDELGYTQAGRIKQEAFSLIRQALLDPGPDLVVCDEGHKIKNLNTEISMSLSSIRTNRRIVLTGYPLQNNLMEYYCMVDFVRPKYLGEKKTFAERFERPIKNGQCVDSTPTDVKIARQRTHVLIEMLKGFVQRRTHHLLKSILPESKEYVILFRKSNIQRVLYKSFVLYANAELRSGNSNVFNPLKAFAACSKIWNHPDILARLLQRARDEKSKKTEQLLANQQQHQNQLPVTTFDSRGYPMAAHQQQQQQQSHLPQPFAMQQALQQYPQTQQQNGMGVGMGQATSMFGGPEQGQQQYFGGQMYGNAGQPMFGNSFGAIGNQTAYDLFPPPPSMHANLSMTDDLWGSVFDGTQMPNSNSSSTTNLVGMDSPSAVNGDALDESKKKRAPRAAKTIAGALMDELDVEEQSLKFDWAEMAMRHFQRGDIENGYKLAMALYLVEECVRIGDKILIFSQNLAVLSLLEEYLDRRPFVNFNGDEQRWCRNKNYFRFDGSTTGTDREKLINRFNTDSSVYLFLISTRAGSLGINLVSANRCIIFDACWNPCHDAQAVCRVYRYGQQRRTYIYRLIMDNSMERAIFNRQISKHGLQQRVVDDAQVDANITQKELETLLMYDESLDVVHDKWDTSEWQIDDDVLTKIVGQFSYMLAGAPFLHESLMLEREEGLSEEEKREAELLFEREKRAEMPGMFEEHRVDSLSGARDFGLNPQHMSFAATPSWILQQNLDEPSMLSTLSSMKATPMPSNMHMLPPYAQKANNNGNPGIPVLQWNENGSARSSDTDFVTPFAGAATSRRPILNSRGSTQEITTDRPMLLPIIGKRGTMYSVPMGSAVLLVRAENGCFIKLKDQTVLDARNTVFNNGLAFSNGADRRPYPYQTLGQAPPFPGNGSRAEPEVIELD